jgi:hypothetical protein
VQLASINRSPAARTLTGTTRAYLLGGYSCATQGRDQTIDDGQNPSTQSRERGYDNRTDQSGRYCILHDRQTFFVAKKCHYLLLHFFTPDLIYFFDTTLGQDQTYAKVREAH